jgi:hypothetical protein
LYATIVHEYGGIDTIINQNLWEMVRVRLQLPAGHKTPGLALHQAWMYYYENGKHSSEHSRSLSAESTNQKARAKSPIGSAGSTKQKASAGSTKQIARAKSPVGRSKSWGANIDRDQLFKVVEDLGGYDEVVKCRNWQSVRRALGLTPVTSSGWSLNKLYIQAILKKELDEEEKGDEDDEDDEDDGAVDKEDEEGEKSNSSNTQCIRCGHVFTTKANLTYHMQHNVCVPVSDEDSDEEEEPQQKKRKVGGNYKKITGTF